MQTSLCEGALMRLLLILTLVLGCAAPAPRKAAPGPPLAPAGATPDEVNAEILTDAKQSAAEQLACPIDQVLMRCTKLDAHGGCVAVQAKGCDKTLDYEFGSE